MRRVPEAKDKMPYGQLPTTLHSLQKARTAMYGQQKPADDP
jgi:hypothetical protein